MQTKFTAVIVVPGLFIMYGWLSKRWWQAIVAVTVAVLLFVSWESYLWLLYGKSHFLGEIGSARGPKLRTKITLILPLVTLLGSTAVCLAPLVWPTWRVKRGVIIAALAGIVLIPTIIIFLPEDVGGRHWLERAIFTLCGILFWTTLILALRKFNWRGKPANGDRLNIDLFLVLWLLVELVSYFATTPFLAVRRIVGIYTASAFILGRVAYQSEQESNQGWVWKYVLAANMTLALIFTGIDWLEAAAVQQVVREASSYINQTDANKQHARWYVGHWGLQYHAESFGMQPIVPGKIVLHAGDWVMIPEPRYDQQRMRTDVPELELVRTMSIEDALPLRTMPYYYWGSYPLVKSTRPRVEVMLYRVKRDYLTEVGKDPHVR